MNTVLAQSVEVGTINPIKIIGPLVGINRLSDIFNVILNFLFPIVGIILLYEFIMAGYVILRSDGTPDKIKEGKQRIVYAIMGLAILVSAYLIVRIVAYILGFGGELF
ncbi:hypothetical protein A2690_03460 [Candidatus Roizmanbacteria bacterium RIFCSPHIGHO2_01_FULL_39_12b]|uniref:Uncharacterized protein n=1 Tax=Candidatus Roizmanbacteria bacterium RIFCSPHIGHO2_01_FULL_39_12b TaxID=1802030 RepID=A0A1F7GDH0_9BACT|nr:MAG: hypothetical protein A2690_03460 [Candidatus Roizmanbacteria bacterium RIFCSPHIGHO2_01_FULL_39_12b]OGK47332.1 MAG: hypothetical protein A3B46_02245 [Candidatus Roizmanbacteria bacterium RIFCSPLOWO2_01_FULL_39_19]